MGGGGQEGGGGGVYSNEFIHNMGFGDPTTCVYQYILDKDYSNNAKFLQYFVMHGLILYIRLNSYVEHVFYEWSFSHNTAVPIVALCTNRTTIALARIDKQFAIECSCTLSSYRKPDCGR